MYKNGPDIAAWPVETPDLEGLKPLVNTDHRWSQSFAMS